MVLLCSCVAQPVLTQAAAHKRPCTSLMVLLLIHQFQAVQWGTLALMTFKVLKSSKALPALQNTVPEQPTG